MDDIVLVTGKVISTSWHTPTRDGWPCSLGSPHGVLTLREWEKIAGLSVAFKTVGLTFSDLEDLNRIYKGYGEGDTYLKLTLSSAPKFGIYMDTCVVQEIKFGHEGEVVPSGKVSLWTKGGIFSVKQIPLEQGLQLRDTMMTAPPTVLHLTLEAVEAEG